MFAAITIFMDVIRILTFQAERPMPRHRKAAVNVSDTDRVR